ncbi:Gfo/Idh/MocA family protein [Devosia sp. RR2S18]|uniref:Gfo/Idh/MocA family protein n=1 Tax=Devosia rhizosphaerae TaxID=3049774 RepID=UPI00253FFCE0|nr:Gfo/Idh/MocA family oxidoreductase [Devosia sp. RR2S18]WIJ24509.1 Gfo/Idh/MocA family oxidoreductase [Devosia sp. RR2S18]
MLLRLGVIGAGLKAADYAQGWAAMPEVKIVAAAEVNPAALDRFGKVCENAGASPPRPFGDADAMLAAMRGQMDAVYVSTPHVLHGANAVAVVEAGYDLLLEKPMVTTQAEALALQDAERRTDRTIVVAFQGGLSPLVHDTRERARRGEFGDLVSVNAAIWEGWAHSYAGQWKQDPAISGGGFMFDTGAHMMNTVCMLADSDFVRVAAFANNRGRMVDLVTVVAAQLSNGALVTFNAAGDGPQGCASAITFFYSKVIVRIDAWGKWREIAGAREEGETRDTPIQTFMAVREGRHPNPSTVADGLRFAKLWDAIKLSAAENGNAVAV